MTRSRRLVVLVGQKKAVAMAVRNVPGAAGGRSWPNGSAPQKIRPPVGPKGNRSPTDRLRPERLCRVPHRFMSMQQEHQRVKKADLADRIADELGITKARAEDAVDAILDEVKLVLSEGEPVILRRFGTFQVRDKRPRLGRNPKTGEEADIPARRVVRFKAGKPFKNAVNGDG